MSCLDLLGDLDVVIDHNFGCLPDTLAFETVDVWAEDLLTDLDVFHGYRAILDSVELNDLLVIVQTRMANCLIELFRAVRALSYCRSV